MQTNTFSFISLAIYSSLIVILRYTCIDSLIDAPLLGIALMIYSCAMLLSVLPYLFFEANKVKQVYCAVCALLNIFCASFIIYTMLSTELLNQAIIYISAFCLGFSLISTLSFFIQDFSPNKIKLCYFLVIAFGIGELFNYIKVLILPSEIFYNEIILGLSFGFLQVLFAIFLLFQLANSSKSFKNNVSEIAENFKSKKFILSAIIINISFFINQAIHFQKISEVFFSSQTFLILIIILIVIIFPLIAFLYLRFGFMNLIFISIIFSVLSPALIILPESNFVFIFFGLITILSTFMFLFSISFFVTEKIYGSKYFYLFLCLPYFCYSLTIGILALWQYYFSDTYFVMVLLNLGCIAVTILYLYINSKLFVKDEKIVKQENNIPLLNIVDKCKILAEKYKLSPRETDVALCLCENMTNTEIAGKLFISENTLKIHIGKILKKMNVKNRSQLLALIINE